MLNQAKELTESNLEVVDSSTSNMADSTSGNRVLSYSDCLIMITYDICKECYPNKIQMDKMRRWIQKLSDNRIIVHTGFILLAGLTLLLIINYYFGNMSAGKGNPDYISILYFFVCVYIGRWICKTWFLKNKLITFSIFTVLGFVILLYGGKLILNALLPLNQKNIDEFFFAITPLFILGMLIGIFAPMIRALLKKQVMEAKTMAEQKQSELNLLQSQLSPHFLFNTLNNLYGISIIQHEKIPSLLLKLSELLQYSVYETRQSFIPLKEEVKYIKNYISFEKIRIGERLNLKVEIEEIISNESKIAPMLLIVFIENAFKHSKKSFEKKIFINISLKIIGENIMFIISNSFSSFKEDNIMSKDGGLGLDNVKRRLPLLYPDEYSLNEESSANLYSVKLQLKVK